MLYLSSELCCVVHEVFLDDVLALCVAYFSSTKVCFVGFFELDKCNTCSKPENLEGRTNELPAAVVS